MRIRSLSPRPYNIAWIGYPHPVGIPTQSVVFYRSRNNLRNMRSLITTGAHLVEDVLMHFTCWNCEGNGFHQSRDPQEEDQKCVECMGSGILY